MNQGQKQTSRKTQYNTLSYDARLAYTVPRAAELASISRSQVYVEIQAGRLTATKIGGRTVILHEDLITWLRNLPRRSTGGGQR